MGLFEFRHHEESNYVEVRGTDPLRESLLC